MCAAGRGDGTVAWIAIEGVNGVGKTRLARAAAARLGDRCRLVAELTDLTPGALPGRVTAALAAGGGSFLRGGCPAAETLALLALKVYEHEHITRSAPTPDLVLEDRGVDTVAVYQTVIMTGPAAPLEEMLAVADQIYAAAARWRPYTDRTVLLVDDLNVCLARVEQRTGARLPEADRALVARVAELYLVLAALEPGRFTVLDRRGRDEADVVEEIFRTCLDTVAEGSCQP
jgi:dTMP kinase